MGRPRKQLEVTPDEEVAPKEQITPALKLRHPEYDPSLPDNKQRHTL